MLKNSIMKEIPFEDEKLIFKFIHKKHNFAKHIHEDKYMIGVCLHGESYFTMDNTEYKMTAGMICLIPANTVHSCKSYDVKGKWQYLTCFIPKDFFHTIVSSIYQENEAFSFKKYFIKDEELGEYLEKIIRATLNDEKVYDHEIINFITIFCEKYISFDKQIKTIENEKFEALFTFLKDEEYNLKELTFYRMAEIMNMNPYYFHRVFSKSIGLTPQTFISFLRVSKATKLLQNYDSLADVALECGFYDQAHFTKEFKKYHGITPTRYKNIF